MPKGDLISRKSLKAKIPELDSHDDCFDIWLKRDDVEDLIDNAQTVNIPNYGGDVVPDMLQGWKYEEKGGAE